MQRQRSKDSTRNDDEPSTEKRAARVTVAWTRQDAARRSTSHQIAFESRIGTARRCGGLNQAQPAPLI